MIRNIKKNTTWHMCLLGLKLPNVKRWANHHEWKMQGDTEITRSYCLSHDKHKHSITGHYQHWEYTDHQDGVRLAQQP